MSMNESDVEISVVNDSAISESYSFCGFNDDKIVTNNNLASLSSTISKSRAKNSVSQEVLSYKKKPTTSIEDYATLKKLSGNKGLTISSITSITNSSKISSEKFSNNAESISILSNLISQGVSITKHPISSHSSVVNSKPHSQGNISGSLALDEDITSASENFKMKTINGNSNINRKKASLPKTSFSSRFNSNPSFLSDSIEDGIEIIGTKVTNRNGIVKSSNPGKNKPKKLITPTRNLSLTSSQKKRPSDFQAEACFGLLDMRNETPSLLLDEGGLSSHREDPVSVNSEDLPNFIGSFTSPIDAENMFRKNLQSTPVKSNMSTPSTVFSKHEENSKSYEKYPPSRGMSAAVPKIDMSIISEKMGTLLKHESFKMKITVPKVLGASFATICENFMVAKKDTEGNEELTIENLLNNTAANGRVFLIPKKRQSVAGT